MKDLFQELPKEQRYEALKGIASKISSEKVRRHYTEDEKTQIKDHVATESIQLMERKDEFKEVAKQFRAACKVSETELRDALTRIKRGYSENDEDVFLVDDQESGVMTAYDRDGVFLYERPLYAEERQTRIVNLQKAS